MIKTKKQMYTVIGVFLLVMLLTTVTYAFFNYTRTGVANNIRTGRIYFNTSQNGNINLTNVFPIGRSSATTDDNNSDEVEITITGDTTYTNGLEYLVTLENVNIETSINKKIPVGIIVTPEKTGELGESDNAYFTNRGGSTSIYKSLIGNSDVIEDGEYVFVGYIRPGVQDVNGIIGIRAFIDKDSIAITDTPDENVEWQEGRMVLSTNEWNELNQNGISFKVRVQSNEGIWVGDPLSRNTSKNISNTFTSEQKSSITEINFIRMSEEMINTHSNAIDITLENGEGLVKAWIDGTKLYIASPGETYLPENSMGYLSSYANVTRINFNNINTSEAENMSNMFAGCNSLSNIDLSNFDTSNVTNMSNMFAGCSSITSIDLHGLGGNNLSAIANMFSGCTSLVDIDMSSFNLGEITYLDGLFSNLYNLEKVDLNNMDTSQIISMSRLFYNCNKLEKIDLSFHGGEQLGNIDEIFKNDNSLKEINMEGFNFHYANMSSLFMGLPNVETINLKNANVSDVGYMSNLFVGCSKLVNLDMTGWSTDRVNNMSAMFAGCSSLTSIDLSGLGSDELENIGGIFSGCINVRNINMSGFNFGWVVNISSLFSGCTNIVSIDLSDIELTGNGFYYADQLFAGDSLLTTIYVSNTWNVDSITSSSGMFLGCTSLVGGNGTTYDGTRTDKNMAIIDGTNNQDGYLTLKIN